jgi:serine phosphatase RsbU (regulator of sigma subunit)
MPIVRDWIAMAKETARSLRRDEVVGLYSREWKSARHQLVSEHRDEIENTRNGLKRFVRVVNAIAFGLVKRLAPPRRLVFAIAGLFLVGAIIEGLQMSSGHRSDAQYWRLASHTVDFLLAAFLLMAFLLAMELVDKLQFRDELVLARELQRDLLPKVVPDFPGYQVSAWNRIANMVGGDLYDLAPLPDGRLAILFGDASGHGMAAGLVMAVAHAAFRTQLDADPSPPALVGALNRTLCRTGGPRSFFSCAYVILASDGAFSATLAGHPPLLLTDAEGAVRRELGEGAYPLGIKGGLAWPAIGGTIAPGELLVFCSDGLAEARNAEGEEFGDARIASIVRTNAWRPASDVVEALATAVVAFCGRVVPEDDVSILVVRRAPA